MANKNEKAGFSLIELIVVLTLLGILAAAIVPIYRDSHESMRADRAVRDLVALLKYAQERAIAESVEYRLYLEPDSGSYWLSHATGLERGQPVFTELTELGEGRRVVPEAVVMEKPKARRDRSEDAFYIGFYPSGACDAATIYLTRDDGQELEIATKGLLGRFEVAER